MSGQPAPGAIESLDIQSEGVYPPPRRTYDELTKTPLSDDGSKKRSRRRHRVTRSRDRRRRRIIKKSQRKFGQYEPSLLAENMQFDDVKQILNATFRIYNASVFKDDQRVAYDISNFIIKYDLSE